MANKCLFEYDKPKNGVKICNTDIEDDQIFCKKHKQIGKMKASKQNLDNTKLIKKDDNPKKKILISDSDNEAISDVDNDSNECIANNELITGNLFTFEPQKINNLYSIITYKKNKKQIKTIIIKNEIKFCAKDVADLLEYKDTNKAITKYVLKKDKFTLIDIINLLTGQNVLPIKFNKNEKNSIYISEYGLWSLVLKSKMDEAKQLQYWLASVVLPSIRKTGSYSIDPLPKQINQVFCSKNYVAQFVGKNILYIVFIQQSTNG